MNNKKLKANIDKKFRIDELNKISLDFVLFYRLRQYKLRVMSNSTTIKS